MSIKFIASSKLPTPFGTFTMHGFEDSETGKEHVALTYGELTGDDVILGRIHSECLTGDALFSLRCDCGFQLETAMKNIT
ncbi:MAG: GTP cyclohydrolase II, partial [Moritella dasanensis]